MEILFKLDGEAVSGVEVKDADLDLAFAVSLLDLAAGIAETVPTREVPGVPVARSDEDG